MKIKKHTLLSALFLFIFISAFSCGAYASISNSIKEFSHSSFNKELKQDGPNAASEDLVFEETENDSEESFNPEFNFLISFLSFDFVDKTFKTNFTKLPQSEKISTPIFLSIRLLRI